MVMLSTSSTVPTRVSDTYPGVRVGGRPAPRRAVSHLHLVPTGALVIQPSPAPAAVFARRRFAAACVALVVIAGALMAGRAMAAGAEVVPQHEVTVRAGETLSEIAAREMPAVRTDQAVVAIEHASNLGSLQVQAGQKLLIPTP